MKKVPGRCHVQQTDSENNLKNEEGTMDQDEQRVKYVDTGQIAGYIPCRERREDTAQPLKTGPTRVYEIH